MEKNDITHMARLPWKEAMVRNVVISGMVPSDQLELRLTSSPKDGDVFSLARRAIKVLFENLFMMPTSIAVHPAIASVFEASETTFAPAFSQFLDADTIARIYGEDFQIRPIHIEVDNSLDIRTVAVRVRLDDFDEAMMRLMHRVFADMRAARGGQR